MTECDLSKSKFLVELMEKSRQIVSLELHDMAERFEASPNPFRSRGFSHGNRNSLR